MADTIGGRYVIEQRTRAGGMGAVHRGRDTVTGAPVAIKFLHRTGVAECDRFTREARTLAELDHPAVVRHVAHGTTEDGEWYLVMEWLEGEDLAERLGRAPLTPRETLALAERVLDGLEAAHARGTVHRDIKPSNIFLPGGRIAEARLLDFGVASVTGANHAVTEKGEVLGTLGYMAPEQATGERSNDPRTDLFALGVVMFECITGRPAFIGDNLIALLSQVLLGDTPRMRRHRTDVPAALDELVARMMARDPEARPAAVADVRSALAALGDLGPMGDETPQGARVRRAALSVSESLLACDVLAAHAQTVSPFGATAPVMAERGADVHQQVTARGPVGRSIVPGEVVVGTEVLVPLLGGRGVVASLPSPGRASVQLGPVKLLVALQDLRLPDPR